MPHAHRSLEQTKAQQILQRISAQHRLHNAAHEMHQALCTVVDAAEPVELGAAIKSAQALVRRIGARVPGQTECPDHRHTTTG